ncbi:MAG: septum formation initiator family protein [Arcicella sp.]|jgi:cell division protein DivIC|nr:septum formation initiator family protein [Arcicella sp.]
MKDLLLNKYRFYTLTTSILLIWMIFFDVNDIFTQIKMYRELSRLEDEKKYYAQKIKEVEKERIEVMGNKKLVEKFAREKYLMKKPKEEIFVLVDENNQPIEK